MELDALVARARRGILKAKAFDLGPSGAVTMSEFEALLDALESERSKRVRLEEALRPFAELDDKAHGNQRYTLELLVCPPEGDTHPRDWGDKIRRARSALSHSSSKGESRE